MQIVELGDCSMVIMKDTSDSWFFSMGTIYREAIKYKNAIEVSNTDSKNPFYIQSTDYIYTAGRLILFFNEDISSKFKVHDKVDLDIVIPYS